MKPSYKSYIWGGDSLHSIYGKDTGGLPVAESWEVSSREDCPSLVAEGEFKGFSISELMERLGEDFCGKAIDKNGDFPLLFKILDAKDNLSVQVHPDDDYAFLYENGEQGKTEAWYILYANEGASLIYGFKDNISKNDLRIAIAEGKVENLLNKIECKKGDVFYIPAGTVHAVGAGLIIAEIQQNSDTTYRLYDYDRINTQGNKRELHIDKAIDVLDFSSVKGLGKTTGRIEVIGNTIVNHLLCNKYFVFDELNIRDYFIDNTADNLIILFIAEGEFSINGTNCKCGDTILLPAAIKMYTIKGKGKILKYSNGC